MKTAVTKCRNDMVKITEVYKKLNSPHITVGQIHTFLHSSTVLQVRTNKVVFANEDYEARRNPKYIGKCSDERRD